MTRYPISHRVPRLFRAIVALILMNAGHISAAPNIVVVLVDDAGLMDFGGYGGEASTPVIDALGDRGVRFANYRTSPLCSPSRAMLLTGLDSHRAGVATIPEVITPAQQGEPGYRLTLASGVETLATKLKQAGYRTYMTGKWHLGDTYEALPVSHGFDRSFALAASGADNFEQKSYMPYYKTAPWFEDGIPASLPADFYSSRFIVEQMIDYLEAESASGQPFFAYLAFQAIHIPIQAPREFIDKYEGTYDGGWDALRRSRWNKARESGLIPSDAPLAPLHEDLDPWTSLSADEQRYYAKSMTVNAAMLEAMDFHFGRFVDYLRRTGEFDNTIFLITSDNGAEFNEPAARPLMQLWMAFNGYNNNVETLGEPGSITHIGPEWASAASSPGSLFKFFATEGGLRVPLVIAGPGIPSRDTFMPARAFVTDLAPTLLDLAQVAPSIKHSGKSMDGTSLMPLLKGTASQVHPPDAAVGMEVSGNAALFRGDYKLRKVTRPFGDDTWQLFNSIDDPGETVDLANIKPDLFDAMMTEYEQYAKQAGVIATPDGFNPVTQVNRNTLKKQFEYYGLWFVIVLSGITVILVLACRWLIKRLRSPAS